MIYEPVGPDGLIGFYNSDELQAGEFEERWFLFLIILLLNAGFSGYSVYNKVRREINEQTYNRKSGFIE